MRRLAAALALLATLAGVAGCTALDPFPTLPEPAKPAQPGRPAPAPRVAMCYNRLATSLAEARSQAQQQCPKGTTADPVATDYWLDYCPVLLPARATFACRPAAGARHSAR
jgi:hypothetical protein